MRIDKAAGPEVRAVVWVGDHEALGTIWNQRDIGEYDRLKPNKFLLKFFQKMAEELAEDEKVLKKLGIA